MRWWWIVIALSCPMLLTIALIVSYFAFEVSTGDDQGFKDFCGEAQVVQDGLQQFFKNKKDYTAYSMEQLQGMGALEDEIPQEYWVYYTPFSSKTPDKAIVLRMGYGPFAVIPSLCDISWTKGQLTHDSMPEENPRKDRLQAAKEKQVEHFVAEHPSCRVVAASAWFNGTVPEDSHAEIIIGYRMQNDPNSHRLHYDFFKKNNDWVWDGNAPKSLN